MNAPILKKLVGFMVKTTKIPLIFLSACYAVYFLWQYFAMRYGWVSPREILIADDVMGATLFIAAYWLVHNVLKLGSILFLQWATTKQHKLMLIVYPPIVSSLNGILVIVLLNMILISLDIQGKLGLILEKSAKILLILVIASVFYKLVASLEQYIINRYIETNSDISTSKKINTQLTILKRVIVTVLCILTFIAITMLFDSIKGLGVSLLTTAGIISAVGAFASQQSLSRLFAGLQLAFTQPIRIGDTVIIDNEFGQVEEISLSFITIKLWDLRRLILPTDYFTNKGLLNLTLDSSELLGTIFLYVDYTLPVDHIRNVFMDLLNQSEHWNQKVSALEVTDIKEKTMEIRCLVSANDSGHLWKLRCEIREKLLKYIVDNHYDCLAINRNVTISTPSFATAKQQILQNTPI